MAEIPNNKYDGYYWMSDEKEPHVLHNEEFDKGLDPIRNPFVIEAQLYDGRMSYSVKFIEGEYVIVSTDLAQIDLNGEAYTERTFLANRMGDGEVWLKFYQQWVEKEDELCENMKVLVPGKLIFAGFAGKEEEK